MSVLLASIQMFRIPAESRAPPSYTKLLLRSLLSPKIQKEKKKKKSSTVLVNFISSLILIPQTTSYTHHNRKAHFLPRTHPREQNQHPAPASLGTPWIFTYACQQVTELGKHSPNTWRGIRVTERKRIASSALLIIPSTNPAEPGKLAASHWVLR